MGADRRARWATTGLLVALAALLVQTVAAAGSGGQVPAGERTDAPPGSTEPLDSDPLDSDPFDSEPLDTDPFDSEPQGSAPLDSEPLDSEPQGSAPLDSEAVESEPVELEPVDSAPSGRVVASADVGGQPLAAPAASTAPATATASASSADVSVLAAGPATRPLYPWGVSARAGNEVVNLSWNAPVRDGGSRVLAYRVQRSTNASDWVTFAWVPASTRQVRATGLQNGRRYYFRVVAVNAVGVSAPSWWAHATPTSAASGLPINPGRLNLRVGSRVAHLTWNAPVRDNGGPTLSYRVQRSTDAQNWQTFAWVPASQRSVWISGLRNDTRYFFRVVAVNANGAGTPSWWATGTPRESSPYVPIHPGGLRTSVRSGTITVAWNPPAYGARPTAYRVQISTRNDRGWSTTAWVPASVRGVTLTGLTNGQRYYLRVVAVNQYGAGAPSWWTAATPNPTTPGRPPPAGGFPTRTSVGVPAGWTPVRTINGDYTVRTAGAVVQDVRINGNLTVAAPNVTIRRVEVVGGVIRNVQGSTCRNGLLIVDSTVRRGTQPTSGHEPAIAHGGYTARNVLIDGMPEGFRVGGDDDGCGPVVIENSYARVVAPDQCGDWHGDGLQGWIGPHVTVRNTVLEFVEREGCRGTAAFFYPSGQGNSAVEVDGLIVSGGGYVFRLGTPGSVQGLYVVDSSWTFGPVSVRCELLSRWQASIARLGVNGQPQIVRALGCSS